MRSVLIVLVGLLLLSSYGYTQDDNSKSRNVKTIGLLVGGSLVGFDYEYRATDYLGVQAGFGLIGYDVALNWHFEETIEGAYLSLEYISNGFGLMNTIGPSYCKRWFFGDSKSWGITAKIGLAKTVSIDSEFEADMLKRLKKDELPPVFLTYGIGISF